ncbi:MAG: DUF2461 domain-containing protein [Acidobacteriota bacterium]|nr:DUF2461 domain-containing protein [Acidobacteriota bacterium]MDQ3417423.1 DUF2461 domain-containing protein [Acidobacteriota bacterium]
MFTPETLEFLRALKRNNDRDWFKARKEKYEQHVRGPMIAVIERLARDFQSFAPEIVASPKTSLYRIYRDTRFSDNKTPLKTQVSASFRWKGLPKGEGAGLYLEVHPQWVWMGGGFWAPPSPQLVRIREHIADTFPEIQRLSRARSFTSVFGTLDGEKLTRVPRGYPKDHPAAEYLQFKQFLAGREFPPEFATSTEFYPALIQTYKAAMPLIRFLNEPLGHDPRR